MRSATARDEHGGGEREHQRDVQRFRGFDACGRVSNHLGSGVPADEAL
jgi:hypothetical protein